MPHPNLTRAYLQRQVGPGLQGIFLLFIPIQDTSAPDITNGNFMDVKIDWIPGSDIYVTSLYDKHRNNYFPGRLTLLTIPTAHSCLSHSSKYGVVTSQLWRFRTLCMSEDDWLDAASDFCGRFLAAGYTVAELRPRVARILPRIHPYFGVRRTVLRDRLWTAFPQLQQWLQV